jgi:bifunctional non-homologous end joining protein LigD
MTRFLVHRHMAGKRHYDLRLIQDDVVRSWSMMKEPPARVGEKRLAIEREELSVAEIGRHRIEEEAFGAGKAQVWDSGDVTFTSAAPGRMVLVFAGAKLAGRYEMRRMRWYPGNQWLLEKSSPSDANLT